MYQNWNPYQMPYSQPRTASQSNLDWIMVQTISQVESVALQPNQKAWIMVQNEPVFALRSSDQMGLVTTEYYRFEKYEPNTATGSFVTSAQLEEALKKLKGEINESIATASHSASKSANDKTVNADA